MRALLRWRDRLKRAIASSGTALTGWTVDESDAQNFVEPSLKVLEGDPLMR
jgi:hypothetical protein